MHPDYELLLENWSQKEVKQVKTLCVNKYTYRFENIFSHNWQK